MTWVGAESWPTRRSGFASAWAFFCVLSFLPGPLFALTSDEPATGGATSESAAQIAADTPEPSDIEDSDEIDSRGDAEARLALTNAPRRRRISAG